jgi:hypothetical protein
MDDFNDQQDELGKAIFSKTQGLLNYFQESIRDTRFSLLNTGVIFPDVNSNPHSVHIDPVTESTIFIEFEVNNSRCKYILHDHRLEILDSTLSEHQLHFYSPDEIIYAIFKSVEKEIEEINELVVKHGKMSGLTFSPFEILVDFLINKMPEGGRQRINCVNNAFEMLRTYSVYIFDEDLKVVEKKFLSFLDENELKIKNSIREEITNQSLDKFADFLLNYEHISDDPETLADELKGLMFEKLAREVVDN